MRVLLRDLAPGQEYAIQFRSNDGEGNVSDWSQVQRFTTTSDTMPPADVQNLTFYASDASFIGQWDAVTTNADGTPLKDFNSYHVQITNGATTADYYVVQPYFEFTNALNLGQFGTYQTVLTITVTAMDNTHNESIHPTSATVNPAAPDTPSTPVVGNYIGLLSVTWDGHNNLGQPMPVSVMYCEVHVSTVNGFTPDNTTMVGRVFNDSGATFVVPNLTKGTTYYVRLVAVNKIQLHSGPSAQASGTPQGISGVDVQDGQISAEQINWVSTTVPGANAYYSTSQPTTPIGAQFNVGDLWYDTDNAYTVYQWNGVTWVLDPNVGFIPGTKILAGTITANAVGANQIITASANIANAVIDDAHISNVSAGKITSGSIAAAQSIVAGDPTEIHAEMRDTGFYVYAPGQSPDGIQAPPMNPVVQMGTGTGDTFSIIDPNDTSSALASISQDGIASFQSTYVADNLVIQGLDFVDDWMSNVAGGTVGSGYIYPITGLNVSDSSGTATGIRTEYGIGQFTFPCKAGHTYRIESRLNSFYFVNAGDEARWLLRAEADTRTQAQVDAGNAPTAVTITSSLFRDGLINSMTAGKWQTPTFIGNWDSSFTGYVTVGLSLQLQNPVSATSVIKIPDNSVLDMHAYDVGETVARTGAFTNMGGSLYNYVAPPPPPPPPPPTVTNYTWSGHFNWVRSYKSNNTYMTNTNGLAYQGLDPSGYNGNQMSYFGFSQVDFPTLLSGATVTSIKLYLYYAHWYYNSGGTAVIGYHGVHGDPGTANYQGGTTNQKQVGGVPKPGSFTIDITSWASVLKSGAARGILLGPGPSTSETYYGYASDCALTVNYQK